MPYKTLTQMTKNMLDPVRGWWDERQLSRVCPVQGADQAQIDAVTAGMVGFLNSSNQFQAGNAANASANKMPLFARGGSLDNDAVRYEGNLASARATATQGTPAATGTVGAEVGISCLVGTGAYELGTTAFQVAASAIAAGDLLMADASAANAFDATGSINTAGRGKIRKFAASTTSLYTAAGTDAAAVNTNQVIGIATSSGGVKNQYGVPMLYFYVNWWPAI
jgi:hypothetical protein